MTNTQIDRTWLIRYYPVNTIRGNWGGGRRGDRILSANVATEEFGATRFKVMTNRASRKKGDKTTIRSRSGYEIQFIAR